MRIPRPERPVEPEPEPELPQLDPHVLAAYERLLRYRWLRAGGRIQIVLQPIPRRVRYVQ